MFVLFYFLQNNFGLLSLEIAASTRRDAGRYVCTATNSAGQAETTSTVTVEGKSHKVTQSHTVFHINLLDEKLIL